MIIENQMEAEALERQFLALSRRLLLNEDEVSVARHSR